MVKIIAHRRRLEVVCLGTIVFCWALLYLPHLRDSPAWYSDETLAVDIAQNLWPGENAAAGVWNTFFTVVYQPVYLLLVRGGLVLAGGDIWGARLLNTLLALGLALVLYFFGRRLLGWRPAALAALFFLSCPQVIGHFRMVFPHNAVALGVCLGALAASLRPTLRHDLAAGLGNLLAVGAHPLGIYGALLTGLRRWKTPRSWWWIAVLPGVTYLVLFFVFQKNVGWIAEDIRQIARSYGTYAAEHSGNLRHNLSVFYFQQDWFHAAGILGMCLMLVGSIRRRSWFVFLCFAVYSLVLFSNRSNLTVFYYQAIILTPFLALGCGLLWNRVVRFGRRYLKNSWRPLGWLVLWGLPLSLVVVQLPTVWRGEIKNRHDPWATQSHAEVEAAAAWLRDNKREGEVVITNTNLGWLLGGSYATLLQWTAYEGHLTFMHEYGTPQDRFRYPLDGTTIRFVALGDIDQIWGLFQPHVEEVLEAQGVLDWPVVWQTAHVLILENPRLARASAIPPAQPPPTE